jgi:DNA-binding transcriptional LysR family regulator
MDLDDRASRRVKLRDLRLLLAVSQWGSMAKAAARLNVSQPAVTKAVADLEDAVGVRLFDRTARGVVLTNYGQALLKHGIAIFDELRQGIREIEFLADPSAGELRIGTIPPLVEMLSELIERLSARHPKMTFQITVGGSLELQRADLRERKIELVLGRIAEADDDEAMEAEVLFNDHLVVIAGANSPWARKRKLKLAELLNERWIVPPGAPGSHAADAFHANGLPVPRIAVVSSSTHLRNLLLATGRYVATAPETELRMSARPPSFKILPIELGDERRPIGIIRLKNRTLSPPAQILIKEAQLLARQMGRGTPAKR